MTSPPGPVYVFKPHEQPLLLGSPHSADHPPARRWAYAAVGTLCGLTSGLGNGLITVNLAYVQGSLGLTSVEAAWLPAVYVACNVCANLVLVKSRQQFGLGPFIQVVLVAYALMTLAHLFVHDFWTAVLLRGASGVAASGLVTLCSLCLLQAMPPPKRLLGMMIGVSIPQLALPIARVLAPSLLGWGDWRMTYYLELGLALSCLAAVLALPLPPSGAREKVFERTDLLTVVLFFPAMVALTGALGLGRIVWWTEAPWIGWSLIAAIVLIAATLVVEHVRARPIIATRWLGRREIVRIAMVALTVRLLVSEQTFGAVGLLGTLGMGTDQLHTLFVVVLLASIAGLAVAVASFSPAVPGRAIRIATICIAVGAFMDAGATNLTRPANLYVSQGLIGFGALLFVGPAMVIGVSRMFLAGPEHFISWVVVFNASQNIGGQLGSALFGTFQTVREKQHSAELVQQIVRTDPQVAQRLAGSARAVGGTILDPALRQAEAGVLLAQQASREAQVLAFNDVFLLIGVLACLAFLWGVAIQRRFDRLGEKSPIVQFGERIAARQAQLQKDAQA